jgi:hypothetical protein
MKSSVLFFFFWYKSGVLSKKKGSQCPKLGHTQGLGNDLTIWCIVHNLIPFFGKRLFSRLELDNKFIFASRLPLLVYCYLCKKNCMVKNSHHYILMLNNNKSIFSQTSPNVKFRYLYSNNCYIYAMLHTIMLLLLCYAMLQTLFAIHIQTIIINVEIHTPAHNISQYICVVPVRGFP